MTSLSLSLFFFLRWSPAFLTRLEYSGAILVQCNLRLPGSSNTPVSQVAGITRVCHHIQLIFVFLVEMGFHHDDQAGLKLLTSGDPPASVSQSAGIAGVSHFDMPFFKNLYISKLSRIKNNNTLLKSNKCPSTVRI